MISHLFCSTFILKAKAEDSSPKPQNTPLHTTASGSSPPSVQQPLSALTNAVRIEHLSDDEDVDITDDLSDDASQPDSQLDEPKGFEQPLEKGELALVDPSSGRLNSHLSNPADASVRPADLSSEGNSSSCQTVAEPETGEQREACLSATSPETYTLPGDESSEGVFTQLA